MPATNFKAIFGQHPIASATGEVPLPGDLALFATGMGAMGLNPRLDESLVAGH
jgi:hypothetical protein